MKTDFVDKALIDLRKDLVAQIARIDGILATSGQAFDFNPERIREVSEEFKNSEKHSADKFNCIEYSDAITIPNKILWVLRSLEKGTAKSVANKLVEIDPKSFSDKKALQDATVHLSRFALNGRIDADKTGHSNIYKYKPVLK